MDSRGELTTYEILWMSGYVERIKAHQVSWPGIRRVNFHAELDGKWTLILSALIDDIRLIRECTTEGAKQRVV